MASKLQIHCDYLFKQYMRTQLFKNLPQKSTASYTRGKKYQMKTLNTQSAERQRWLPWLKSTLEIFLGPRSGPKKLPVSTKLTVVLTGSTGSLGGHLLRAILKDSNIAKVYCLNWSPDAQARQKKWFASVGLDDEYDLNGQKADFIGVDFSRRNFGLPIAQFDKLTSSTDILIHNAWKADFNHSLESFEHVHIQGVRNLISWSIDSDRHPHIIFVSSIFPVGN